MSNINERVKDVRAILGYSGAKFGERLGVQRNAISQIETNKNGVSEQIIKAICREFAVNEQWLRTGEGDMFIETTKSVLDKIGNQYNLDEFDLKVIENYMKLKPEHRESIKSFLKTIVKD